MSEVADTASRNAYASAFYCAIIFLAYPFSDWQCPSRDRNERVVGLSFHGRMRIQKELVLLGRE
jgi:hypothetical protein